MTKTRLAIAIGALAATSLHAQLPQPPTMIRTRIAADRRSRCRPQRESSHRFEEGRLHRGRRRCRTGDLVLRGAGADTNRSAATPGGRPQLLVANRDVTAQDRRVFLILLGRGRMGSGPSKERDALVMFLSERCCRRMSSR